MENLIFLPGASGNLQFWQPVMSRLSPHYTKKILAYPEFGGMPAKVGIQSFNDLQHGVINSIKCLSQKQSSIVIAQSMGGIFAVQAALKFPHLVKASVLVATSGGIDLSTFNVMDWRQQYQHDYALPDWFVGHHEYMDDELAKIKCPILLIWGDADPISPPSVGRYLESQFKQANLEIIQGGKHDLAFECAEQVTHLIESFIHSIE